MVLLLIGFFIIKTQIVIGDQCEGIIETFYIFLLSLAYLIILFVETVISVITYFKAKETISYFPWIITLLIVITLAIVRKEEKFERSTVLYATLENKHSLMLCKNNTFKIKIQYVEWSCYYTGKYKIMKDTLLLSRNDIESTTAGLFTNNYLIDNNKNLLYPLATANCLTDTSKWLAIELPLARVLDQ